MPEAASNLFGEEGPTLALEIKPFANIPTKSLADLLSHKLRGHCEEERSFDPDNPVTKMWERLCCIHEEMKTAEIFNLRIDSATASEKRILYHWDLEPRNILVNRTPDGAGWLIDMVIDWDRVQAVPSVLARKPPVWLWDFSDDTGRASIASDYDGDIDLLEPTRYDNDSGRLSADNQHIRRHFEDRFVSELANVYPGYDQEAYVQESYGHGRWIRRLARFAIHGASDNQDLTRFEHLDSDWSAFLADKSKSREVAEA